jgi:hypothetical protein
MSKKNNNSSEKAAPLDFSGQKLAGRSFRGKDFREAGLIDL